MPIKTEKVQITTPRRRIAAYRLSRPGLPRLMLVHGNASSGAFFFPVAERLADFFDIVIPDLNGFGDTEASPIHAPTALVDWAEDLNALADAIGFERFALLGWSLGGGVVMKYAIRFPERLTHLLLLSPMSPYGFGGTRGETGEMYAENGWGSPGGFANPGFLQKLKEQDRGDDPLAPRSVLKGLFAQGWPVDEAHQELFVNELFKMQLGEDYYPGDFIPQAAFPYVLPGARGISNSLAPQYANVSAIQDIKPQVPILWMRGDQDKLVSDQSFSDLATLGMLGLLPGYPGVDVFPPQPMVAQTRAVLEQYKHKGGSYREVVFEGCAHGACLEDPDKFIEELKAFIV